jgi:hypothetical protein
MQFTRAKDEHDTELPGLPYTRAHVNARTRDSALYAGVVCAAIGLGLFLHWPSLYAGLRSDDFPQRAMLRGEFAAPRSPLDMFNFVSGEATDLQRLMDFGYMPWWTVPNLRLRMWRPVASALMVLDQRVLDLSAVAQHAHSLLWYVLLVLVASRLFRRWLQLPAAAVATLLFAIEEGHTVPVSWLANRSTLTATALGLLTLELHASARETASGSEARSVAIARAAATAMCAALALLSGEYAFTALAYVFAYECFRTEPLRARIRHSLPVVVPAVLYLVAHSFVGSDIVGSGFYISPLREPFAYAREAMLRVPAMFADLSFGMPAEWYNSNGPLRNYILQKNWFGPVMWRRFPGWPVWHGAIGALTLIAFAFFLREARARAPESSRRPLHVMALGALLSLVPAAGSLPGDRLIVAAALGVSGVYGALIVHALPRPGRFALRTVCAWLVAFVVGGPWSAHRVYDQVRGFVFSGEGQRIWARAAEMPPRAQAGQTRVYLISNADFMTAANLPWARLAEGAAVPLSYRRLGPGAIPCDVLRTSERSLRFMPLSSDLRYSAIPTLYRSDEAPMHAGQLIRMPGLDVLVEQVREGNPSLMHFTFDRPLEDPSLWFLESTMDGLKRWQPPKIGETTRVKRPVYRDLRIPPEEF